MFFGEFYFFFKSRFCMSISFFPFQQNQTFDFVDAGLSSPYDALISVSFPSDALLNRIVLRKRKYNVCQSVYAIRA